jgi:hypothetical protein
MKSRLLLFILIPLFTCSNIAKPWQDGSVHSVMYSNTDCIVEKESIIIDIIKNYEPKRNYIASYRVSYSVHTETDTLLPLVFVGKDLIDKENVLVNSQAVETINLIDSASAQPDIRFDDENLSDLIYFQADLKKGTNLIEVDYKGKAHHGLTDYDRVYKLQYSLYPAKYWKSFGKIRIVLNLTDELEYEGSNVGEPLTVQNNQVILETAATTVDQLEIKFSRKKTAIACFLIANHPFRIPLLIFVLSAFLHFRAMRYRRSKHPFAYNFFLPLGIILVPTLFYATYNYFNWLIDSILHQDTDDYGSAIFMVLTPPAFFLVYGLIMWVADALLKALYVKRTPSG